MHVANESLIWDIGMIDCLAKVISPHTMNSSAPALGTCMLRAAFNSHHAWSRIQSHSPVFLNVF
jgi:hypothetical protein